MLPVRAVQSVILSVAILAGHAAEMDVDAVKMILHAARRDSNKASAKEHAEDLRPLGEKAIPLLATLLEDGSFSVDAADTMLAIDTDRAAPLVFASMPKCDRDVSSRVFRIFSHRLEKGEKLPFSSAMHDAAVRCLEAQTGGNQVVEALLVIGLTGSDADSPLLEKYYDNRISVEFRRRKCQNAAEAALARIGHPVYLKAIETKLAASVSAPLTAARANTLESAIMEAGFSQNRRFVPLLVNHLNDPPADVHPSDYSLPDPAGVARIAIYEILTHTSSGMDLTNIDSEKMKEWWKQDVIDFSN